MKKAVKSIENKAAKFINDNFAMIAGIAFAAIVAATVAARIFDLVTKFGI